MATTSLLILVFFLVITGAGKKVGASWCVARSNVNQQQLQTALDYACGAGADCAPIQPDGLCFLPNNLLSHASYAFNSYYQRKSNAPGSCDFSASATIAPTDPSYGSCVYPPSPSSAGGGPTTPTPPTTPAPPGTIIPNPPLGPPPPPFGFGGLTPSTSPPIVPDSSVLLIPHATTILFSCLFIAYLLHF